MTNYYNKPFEITENVGNNVFCFNKISNPKIHIAKLIKGDISNIKIGKKTVFREQKNGKIITYKGLKDFVKIAPFEKGNRGDLKPNIYIFDNHNHALYFRYKEYFAGNIDKGTELIHIDQHTDMNHFTPLKKEGRGDFKTLNGIFHITNYQCNVGNFIQPAIQDGLISKVHQINTEHTILNTGKDFFTLNSKLGIITDIDLDFRAPEMSIQKYQETINITKKLIKNSRVVTIATSPYFLDQNLAIKVLKDLFE